jgi:hypothetical protein
LPSIAALLALAGCGPAVELETDASSTSDESSTTGVPGDSTTTTTDESSSTTDAMPPDMGEPEPTTCGAGAGDLMLEWTVSQPGEGRADAVATGAGRVAWATGEFSDSRLRVLDVDGNPLWDDAVPLFGGEGELSMEDLEIDPAGNVILAGAIDGDALDALFRWYDAGGNVLAEDVHTTPGFDTWQGVARLPDGDVVAAGESGDSMFVRRYTPGAEEVWSQSFSEDGAAWSSHVAVAPDGTLFVSGHSNTIPGPVLLAYDPEGTLLWSYIVPEDGVLELEIASSVAADDQGRAWMTVISDDDTAQRVDRFDGTGAIDLTIPLDFRPNAIATDPDGAIVVAGAILGGGDGLIVVERYDAEGTHVARHERPGRFATGVAVDEDCHAYVVGYTLGGEAWLERLR